MIKTITFSPSEFLYYTTHPVIYIYYSMPLSFQILCSYIHTSIFPFQLDSKIFLLKNRDHRSYSGFSASYLPPICKCANIFPPRGDNDTSVISVHNKHWDSCTRPWAGYRDKRKATNPRMCSINRVSMRQKSALATTSKQWRILLTFWLMRYFKNIVSALVRDLH